MAKRIMGALLALLMLMSVLAGCQADAPAGSASSALPSVPGSSSSAGSAGPSIPGSSSPHTTPPAVMPVTVTFVVGDEAESFVLTVTPGQTVQKPMPDPVEGKAFCGWYADPDYLGQEFDFDTPISADLTLYAKWEILESRICYSYAGLECAAFEWAEENASAAKVAYRKSGTGAYTYVDAPLIRSLDGSTARVDILGLAGGSSYDFLIVTGDGEELTATSVSIGAYDRSGYAHFGYDEGVGAYRDDGTLKEGALVLYLTEGNKNDVLASAYVDGQTVDISPYLKSGDTQYTGIGQLLNTGRFSGSDRFEVGIAKLCQVYGAVTIRVLGTVAAQQNADGTSTILGLTDYNSRGNGGTPGDNGRMARMVNAHDLTVEGVGEDAVLEGWGLHFIADDANNLLPGSGESFEVRNLTFRNYPEDAVGMEGQQEGNADGVLTDPVQRCWIHHNSFYPGYCANPAESDKAEGDGSCDFKRGRYYTLSYNYFVDCHKTNLIGSGDSSLQFDITFHHNYWENCGSRMPLVRNTNLHFYNNYISNDISLTYGSTGTKLGLSYVSSVRANSFVFTENNYYDGCKNVVLVQSGGVVKAYGNTYYACLEEDNSVKVSSRQEKVTNHCAYRALGIDYSGFDTDPTLFYYDAEAQCSDCYLTDAVTAREEVIRSAGVQKRAGTDVDTSLNLYTPGSALQMTEETLHVDLTGITAGTVRHGIYFNGKTSGSNLKGKNQVVTFLLLTQTDVHITVAAGKDVNLGELVGSDGTVWASKFTEFSGTLPAGIYFIASGSKDKEVTITGLSFTQTATPEQRLETVIAAIDSIPEPVTLSAECKQAIDYAWAAWQALPAQLQEQVTNFAKLEAAVKQYDALALAQETDQLKSLLGQLPETLTAEHAAAFREVKALYETRESWALTDQEQAKYQSLLSQYGQLKQPDILVLFTGEHPEYAADAGFTVSGNYKVGVSYEYEGVTYNRPLKMESATTVTFTLQDAVTLTLRVDAPGKNIKIDGSKYAADAEGTVTVTLEAGSHTITKGDSCNLCWILLAPEI